MMLESLLPFFIFLVIIVVSILRKGKKEGSHVPERPRYAKLPPSSKPIPAKPKQIDLKKAVKKPLVSYEVEKKKTHPILQNNWQDKGSLKKAFILSEVLKKADEREFF